MFSVWGVLELDNPMILKVELQVAMKGEDVCQRNVKLFPSIGIVRFSESRSDSCAIHSLASKWLCLSR